MAANPKYLLPYKIASSLAGLLGWPLFYRHLRSRGRGESFFPRLGLQLPAAPPPGSPRVWLHGVSVGEILAAVPLVQELKSLLPGAAFIISTGTETGQALARRLFAPQEALVCYFPLDLPWAVNRYLDFLRPQVFIGLESEIWPNFLCAAHQRGVRLVLANARLSDQTFRRYVKYNKYVYDIINLYDLFIAGSSPDLARLQLLGLSSDKLHFFGNLKLDRLLQSLDHKIVSTFSGLLNINGAPVFLAASTHPGEEELILEAYEKLRAPYPSLLLILAPRHPERAAALGRLLSQYGLPFHFWQNLKSGRETREHPVVLIDTIGDLFFLYGLADIPFVGGSLVPHGGQNLLEPAAWGRVPLYGPHISNFRWAQAILDEAGAGLMVKDAPSLAAAAQDLLNHPEYRHKLGAQARAALTPHQGAARRQAQLIVRMLAGGGG